ncbi:SDR family NAD(P)-dependent oxidoreductase [Neolewinella litorea]|uniref:SDR family NAD(P)-dependent oxidoreductase n=1 Tax=Neolewinella litorea TaxID=2562452 RepID=A0A4S4NKZ0_9BACT|nr:SDR family NAD(P)-dependent oxidoreductase [Neolewinella litorea]THH40509.1 SDR family NAD(P)-dependent oxidoreductase [Neolewinella litorea]
MNFPPISNLISFEGKFVAVTGACSDIGQRTAMRFAESGARVILLDSDEDELSRLSDKIIAQGYRAHGHPLDITDLDRIRDVADHIDREHGHLDVWCTVANIFPCAPVLEMDGTSFQRMVDLNLKGTFFCAQQAARVMIEAGTGGTIINVIAPAQRKTSTHQGSYLSTKGAMHGFTRALAVELAERNIRVLAVDPTLEHVSSPDEVARLVFFAASDLATIMSGSSLQTASF